MSEAPTMAVNAVATTMTRVAFRVDPGSWMKRAHTPPGKVRCVSSRRAGASTSAMSFGSGSLTTVHHPVIGYGAAPTGTVIAADEFSVSAVTTGRGLGVPRQSNSPRMTPNTAR